MSTLGSYFLYYFIVIFSSIIAYFSDIFGKTKNEKMGKYLFYSAIFFPVLIAGIRSGIGTDFNNYYAMYYKLTDGYFSLFSAIEGTRYEPGWVALNFLVKYTFGDPQFVFVVSALLTWLLGFKAIYDNKSRISVGIAVLILLCAFYNISFNTIRQSLAISIIMLSVKPIIDKKFLKFFILVLFATAFHYTALIFLPAYWVANSKTGNGSLFKKVFITIAFASLVFFINPILSLITKFEMFSFYSSYELEYSGLTILPLISKIPIIILILLNLKKLKNSNNPMHKLAIFIFLGIILSSLASFAPQIDRVARYFDVMQVFVVAAIIKVQKDKHEKLLYTYFVVLFYLFWLTLFFLILGQQGTVPYQWI